MKKRKLIIILSAIIALVGISCFAVYFFSSKKEKIPSEEKIVKLYYYSPELDQDLEGNILCSSLGLVPVERKISSTTNAIADTINLLLKGDLTSAEKEGGITTEYPLEGLAIKSADLSNGILTLGFEDPNYKTSGGACRAGILWLQIDATATQFPQVKEVKFYPPDLFQP